MSAALGFKDSEKSPVSLKFRSVSCMDGFKAPPENFSFSVAEIISFHSSAQNNFTLQLMVTPPLTVVSLQIKAVGIPSLTTTVSSQSEGEQTFVTIIDASLKMNWIEHIKSYYTAAVSFCFLFFKSYTQRIGLYFSSQVKPTCPYVV